MDVRLSYVDVKCDFALSHPLAGAMPPGAGVQNKNLGCKVIILIIIKGQILVNKIGDLTSVICCTINSCPSAGIAGLRCLSGLT